MTLVKNKTIKDFFNYFFSDLFIKGFLFISLPILSRVMTPSEYGKLSLVNSAIYILFVFLSLNIQNSISNRYMRDTNHFGSYLFSNLVLVIPLQIIVILVSPFYLKYLTHWFGLSSSDLLWVIIICSLLSIFYIYTCYLQAAQLSREFSMLNIISKLVEIILIITFAVFLTKNQYLSKIYAQFIVTIGFLSVVLPRIYKLLTFKFNVCYIKDSLLFAVPLIPHAIANNLLSQVDRFFVNSKMGVAAAGIYSFSYNLGMAIIIIILAWNSSWQPMLYGLLKQNNKDKIKDTCFNSSVVMLFFSMLAILFSQEMVVVFSDFEYYASIKIIPIIVIGNSLLHINLTYSNFSFYEKKTTFISIATSIALGVNVFLNIILIPVFGIEGAAWATVAAYVCLTICHYIISTFVLKLNFISIKLFYGYFFSLLVFYFSFLFMDKYVSYFYVFLIKILVAFTIGFFLFRYMRRFKF